MASHPSASAPCVLQIRDIEAQLAPSVALPQPVRALPAAQQRLVAERCMGAQARAGAQQVASDTALAASLQAQWARWANTSGDLESQLSDDDQTTAYMQTLPRAFHFPSYAAMPSTTDARYPDISLYGEAVAAADQDAVTTGVRHPLLQHTQRAQSSGRAVPAGTHPQIDVHISVYSRRHITLTRKMHHGEEAPESASNDELDYGLCLSQKIECAIDTTLDSLARGIVCRSDDTPECMAPAGHLQNSHWTDMEDAGVNTHPVYPQFTGMAVPTDVCMMIDHQLYGRYRADSELSYVRALSGLRNTGSALSNARHSTKTLSEVSFADLGCLRFGQPNWLLHMGDCEHVWIVDRVSYVKLAGTRAHPRRNPTPTGSPRTTFLQRSATTSLARNYLAPQKLVTHRAAGRVQCDLCEGMRDAVAILVGGDQVQIPDSGTRLAGCSRMVTPCCGACFEAATGQRFYLPLTGEAAMRWTAVPLHPRQPVAGVAKKEA